MKQAQGLNFEVYEEERGGRMCPSSIVGATKMETYHKASQGSYSLFFIILMAPELHAFTVGSSIG